MKAFRWFLSLISIALVVAIALWELRTSRDSPGPVHPSHANVPALANGTNCDACHRSGEGVDQERCIVCHDPIGKQRAARQGLHGSMPPEKLASCEQCHPEHHGDTAPLIASHAFAGSGVDDPLRYDHRHVRDYALAGSHLALPCARCHSAADAKAAPAGGRFLGLSQTCSSCHEDVHRGIYGTGCVQCHGQDQPFRMAPGFRHESLPLRDAHARVTCAECHALGSAHDIAALQLKPQPTRACNACHQDPHHGPSDVKVSGKQINALHIAADTADCSRCHAATEWRAAKVTPEQHAKFGVPLRGVHATTDCVVCHGNQQQQPRYTSAQTRIDDCAVCHQNPHQGDMVALATAQQGPAQGCAGCHGDADAKFRRGSMTLAQHDFTGFVLSSPHAKLDCAKCHQGELHAQRFPGRKASNCRACHQDTHKGQFDHEPRFAQCTACHIETTFRPHAFDLAAHERTPFPLTGSHQAVACQLCHKNELATGVRAFHGQKSACSDCHQDVHQGKFDAAGRPVAVDGRIGCQRCHDTKAFTPVATFDHRLWTGYPLEGAHQRVECTGCHTPKNEPGERRLGPPAGTRCADCHRDVHQGQFVLGGDQAADCARCHGLEDFKKPHFDHQKDSRFPLDKQHRDLACTKCHKSYESPSGPVVRYKPLGITCGDCHQLGAKGIRR
jgi:hypothetical protein